MPTITLKTADAAATLSAAGWWDLASLRRLLGGQPATVLGYDTGPDTYAPLYAFLASDVSPAFAPALKTVRRFFVVLRDHCLLSLDLASGPGAANWRLDGALPAGLTHRAILPKPGTPVREDKVFLNVLLPPSLNAEPVLSVDLAGARIGDTVVLFHTETGMAGSSLFFDVAGVGNVRILIAGLSPGFWEVWRDGFLEDNSRLVHPQKGALYYEGEAGGYFLRRR